MCFSAAYGSRLEPRRASGLVSGTTGGATGGLGYGPPLFENMGLVIRTNFHRNGEGGVEWAGLNKIHTL